MTTAGSSYQICNRIGVTSFHVRGKRVKADRTSPIFRRNAPTSTEDSFRTADIAPAFASALFITCETVASIALSGAERRRSVGDRAGADGWQ